MGQRFPLILFRKRSLVGIRPPRSTLSSFALKLIAIVDTERTLRMHLRCFNQTNLSFCFEHLYMASIAEISSNQDDPVLQSKKNTKVQYTRLGNSGLRVSVPILGAMSFGSPAWDENWVIEEEEALPLLKAAYDRGLNTWDTGQ